MFGFICVGWKRRKKQLKIQTKEHCKHVTWTKGKEKRRKEREIEKETKGHIGQERVAYFRMILSFKRLFKRCKCTFLCGLDFASDELFVYLHIFAFDLLLAHDNRSFFLNFTTVQFLTVTFQNTNKHRSWWMNGCILLQYYSTLKMLRASFFLVE